MRSAPSAVAALVTVIISAALLTGCGRDGDGVDDAAETTTAAPGLATGDDTPWIDPDYTGGDGLRVAVLGDSITRQSMEELRVVLADHALRTAAVQGEGFAGGGYSSAWDRTLMLDAAAVLGASEPDVAVLALGTNDAWTPDGTLPDALDALDTIVADLSGELPRGRARRRRRAGGGLRSRRRRRDRSTADRGGRRRGRLGAIADEDGVLTDDGIHPTPTGQQRWAEEVAAAVEACPSA